MSINNFTDKKSQLDDESVTFLTAIMQNLHQHTFACFKKGEEGRCHSPKENCEKTTFHSHEDEKIPWFSWNGTRMNCITTTTEIKRHPMDAFANQHGPFTSDLFSCDSDVQGGMGGAHAMCCSCCATEANKKRNSIHDGCMWGSLTVIKKRNKTAK